VKRRRVRRLRIWQPQNAFGEQRFHAFDDDAAAHFGGGRRPDLLVSHLNLHSERGQTLTELRRRFPTRQHGRLMPVRWNRGHDGYFYKTRSRGVDDICDRSLQCGGNGIHLGVEMPGCEMGRGLRGGVCRLIRGHHAKDNVGDLRQLTVRADQTRSALRGARLNNFAGPGRIGVDVEGCEACDSSASKAFGKVKSGFAKSNESNGGSVIHFVNANTRRRRKGSSARLSVHRHRLPGKQSGQPGVQASRAF
jgi:hypothetical protein